MEKPNKKLAVIFDMDGVIIDSNPLITRCWKAFFEKHHIVLSDEQLNQYVFGRTAQETLKMVFPPDLAPKSINSFADEVARHVQLLYIKEGHIVPGFMKFVKKLTAHQIPMAISTSAPTENVNIVLELTGVRSYISAITDASELNHSKPHPEGYLKTAEKLGIPPTDCCVIEDSLSGIQSARSARMKVIGITTTHSAHELLPLTEAVIADFNDLNLDDIKRIVENKFT
jgi:beta-phosphoglucomutase